MEEIIKIQEEFESLISELEQLKKVNQLTTENTHNTTKVIAEISTFINSVNAFKMSVIKDYEDKKANFENAVESLNSSFKVINNNTSLQSKKMVSLLDHTKKSVNQEVEDLKVKIKSITDEYINSLKAVNSGIQKNIELFTQNTTNSIEEREASLAVKTGNINNKIDLARHELKQIKEENKLMYAQISNSLELKLRSLNTQLENGLESIKLNQAKDLKVVNDKIQEQQKVISDLIFSEIKKNREEVKLNRIILIVLIVILIATMIYTAVR